MEIVIAVLVLAALAPNVRVAADEGGGARPFCVAVMSVERRRGENYAAATLDGLMGALLMHPRPAGFLPLHVVLGSGSAQHILAAAELPAVRVHRWDAPLLDACTRRSLHFVSSLNYARVLSLWGGDGSAAASSTGGGGGFGCNTTTASGLLVIEDDVELADDFFEAMQVRIAELERGAARGTSPARYWLECYRPAGMCRAPPTALRLDPALIGESHEACCTQCRYYPGRIVAELRDAIVAQWAAVARDPAPAASAAHFDKAGQPYDLLVNDYMRGRAAAGGATWLRACTAPRDLAQHMGRQSTGLAGAAPHASNRYIRRPRIGSAEPPEAAKAHAFAASTLGLPADIVAAINAASQQRHGAPTPPAPSLPDYVDILAAGHARLYPDAAAGAAAYENAGAADVECVEDSKTGAWCLRADMRSATRVWPDVVLPENHVLADAGLVAALHGVLRDGELRVLDMGAGVGQYEAAGLRADAVDGALNVEAYTRGRVHRADFTDPEMLAPRGAALPYDWVLSLEVGEHIPRSGTEAYVENMHRLSSHGIVLSWAVPGQGGHGHVNEMSNADVVKMIEGRGRYTYDAAASQALRAAVSDLWWLRNTLMVFRASV